MQREPEAANHDSKIATLKKFVRIHQWRRLSACMKPPLRTSSVFPATNSALVALLAMTFIICSARSQETFYNFPGAPGGDAPLIQATDGNFYGTTYLGGSNNLGMIFRMASDGAVTSLVSFNQTNGGYPTSGVVQGTDGNLYGTTYWGGSNNLGTIFKMSTDGTLATLVSFNATNGGHPNARLLQGSDGNFYGTTQLGGNLTLNGASGLGTIFKMSADGTLTTLVAA